MDSTAETPHTSLLARLFSGRSLAVALAVTVSACGEPFFPDAPRDDSILEGPIAGLTAPQHALFLRGDAEFGRAFASTEGLGPLFIAQSCDACHAGDGKGHPVFDITRFGRYAGATFYGTQLRGLAHCSSASLRTSSFVRHRNHNTLI